MFSFSTNTFHANFVDNKYKSLDICKVKFFFNINPGNINFGPSKIPDQLLIVDGILLEGEGKAYRSRSSGVKSGIAEAQTRDNNMFKSA